MPCLLFLILHVIYSSRQQCQFGDILLLTDIAPFASARRVMDEMDQNDVNDALRSQRPGQYSFLCIILCKPFHLSRHEPPLEINHT
jgi:hypothetical protein